MSVNPAAPAAPPVVPAAVQPAPVVPAVETPPVVPAVQVAPPVPVADPNLVTVPKATLEKYQGYEAIVAKLEADKQVAEAARKEAELQKQIEQGQIKETLALIKKQADDATAAERSQRALVEDRAKKYALTAEVSRELSAQPLGDGAAEQLMELWKNEFVVEAVGDSYGVRTPAHQSVRDFIAAKLATPLFARFLRPSTHGGVGANPAASTSIPTPPSNPAAPIEPKNFSEGIILQMAEMKKNQPGGGDSRLNPNMAMGLNSRSMVRNA